MPNNAEIDYYTMAIYRRQGRWSAAIAAIERCTILAGGDPGSAQPIEALQTTESEAGAFQLDPFRQAQGLFYVSLGRKEDALRQGHRAVELLPEAKDAFDGPCLSGLIAFICCRTGNQTGQLHHSNTCPP